MRKLAPCLISLFTITSVSLAWAAPVTDGGPGGLGATDGSSTLQLWFQASEGVFSDTSGTTAAGNGDAVGHWQNLSGFNNAGNLYNAIGDTAGREPTLMTGQTPNGGPTLNFAGGAKNTGSRLDATEAGNYPMSGNETAFFALDFTTGQTCCRGILSGNDGPNRAYAGGVNTMFGDTAPDPPGSPNNFTYASNYVVDGVDTPTTGSGFHVITGELNPTAASNVRMVFGAGHGGNADYGGRLAEAIVFDEQLNRAQQIVVENYLSALHDIPLTTGDNYVGDDAASGDYDFGVFGVAGVDPGTGLVTHLSGGSEGLGIEVAALTDGESIMAGHNGGGAALTNAGLNNPLDVRMVQSWFIDERAAVDVELRFEPEDAGIDPLVANGLTRLVFSPDGGAFSTVPIDGIFNPDGSLSFMLTAADLQTGVFSLATAVPEPSTGLLMAVGLVGLIRRRRRS